MYDNIASINKTEYNSKWNESFTSATNLGYKGINNKKMLQSK